MKLSRPNPESAVQVTAIDKETGKSKTMTVYDTTAESVIELLRRAAEDAADNADEPTPTATN